eukprot:Lithocolla_globosa_v1_NODE_3074_length_1772_cov_7.377985.p3 type:complete len:110 gc:universal NODE_3074_length_1772_cov_7.377985:1279-1608(+)
MINYSNGKIYMIVSLSNSGEKFIGGSVLPISRIKYEAIQQTRKFDSGLIKQKPEYYDIVKSGAFVVKMIEAFPNCKSKDQLNTHVFNTIMQLINENLVNKEAMMIKNSG